MSDAPVERPKRRPRYRGSHPSAFHDKYKELNPERYADEVTKVVASGKTPAGMHRSIMVQEILECLTPTPGDFVVDATVGYGGHAAALLDAAGSSRIVAFGGGRVIDAAKASQKRWGIPASITLAQWIVESAWGSAMPKVSAA